MVVLVGDLSDGSDVSEKLTNVVFKAENVALGMKAFRAVQIAAADAPNDPLVADAGKEVPRLLVWDPVAARMSVLEKGKLTAGSLFRAMKHVADGFYEEDLEKTVKTHLKLLVELDKTANQDKVLTEKEAKLSSEEGASAKKDLEEVRKELDEVRALIEDLQKKQSSIWKLTLKALKAV
jgi:hypothetical protein